MKRIVYLLAFVALVGLMGTGLFGCEQKSAIKTDSVAATPAKPAKKMPAFYPIIVEMIMKPGWEKRMPDILADAKWLSERRGEINSWKSHMVVFAMVPNVSYLTDNLKEDWRGLYDSLKVYEKPFYKFDRSKCADTTTSKEWTNIFLTTNLVADPKLQQEYLDYHKIQFEKWPEVSNGFCNASFQQLLVFKNGRQLMLVISIPKGKTLDELNPLTTKNNPRVDDWNKLMSKYQEGLPGTKKGETWVFLKPLGD